VFRIRIDLNTDPDPAFEVNTDPAPDPDLDQGFFATKMKEIFLLKTFFFPVTKCYKDIDRGLTGSCKNH